MWDYNSYKERQKKERNNALLKLKIKIWVFLIKSALLPAPNYFISLLFILLKSAIVYFDKCLRINNDICEDAYASAVQYEKEKSFRR